MTLEDYWAEKYPLKFRDFLPGGYDSYCDRNHIINAECINTFSTSNNPYIYKVQNRARFLRDGVQPLWFIATVPVVFGATALASGAVIYVLEKTKSLIDKLF